MEHTWSTFIERAEDDKEEALEVHKLDYHDIISTMSSQDFLSLISLLKISFQGRALISEFQQHKFRHFFYHVLDLNNDHVISQEDFDGIYLNPCYPDSLKCVTCHTSGLNSRVRHYMAWGVNSPQYLTLTEVHDHFISYFLHTSAKFAKVNKSKKKLQQKL